MTAREKRRRAKDQREKERLWRCKERSGYHVRTFGPHNVRVFVASSAVHDSKGAVSVFSTRLMDTTKASAKSRHCEEVRSRGLTVISTAIMPI